MIARVELVMSFFLLLVILIISIKGWDMIQGANYTMVDWKYLILPYGVMLFSLDGSGSLPIVAKLLRKNRKKVKKVVRYGTIIPAIAIILFTLVVVGLTGKNTTPDAILGIQKVFGNGVVFLALLYISLKNLLSGDWPLCLIILIN